MSVRVMTAVWSIDLPDSEKIVLLALADCANDEGGCWPSMATLAKKCSKSDRTVQAAIKSLVAAGHLGRVEIPGRGCRYVVLPTPEAAAGVKPLPPEETAPLKRTTPTPEAASDKPSRTINSQKTSSSSKRASESRFVLPDDIPSEPWAGFEEMRKAIHKPMTLKAKNLAVGRLRKLADAGYPPGDVLNHSILNNYQGLFPPKDDRNGIQRYAEAANDGNGPTVRAAIRAKHILDQRAGLV